MDGVPAVGRRAITEVAQKFISAFPDIDLRMDHIRMQANRAEYRWTFIGTNTGPGGTGHRVGFRGFEKWKIGEDGLIAELRGNFDCADYQRQAELGVEESHQECKIACRECCKRGY